MDKCAVRTNERMVNHGNAQDNRVHVYTLREEGAAEQYDGASAAWEMSAQAGQSAALMGGESDVLRCIAEMRENHERSAGISQGA